MLIYFFDQKLQDLKPLMEHWLCGAELLRVPPELFLWQEDWYPPSQS